MSEIAALEALRKEIKRLVTHRFTPAQIAEDYLNTPFDKRPLPPGCEADKAKEQIVKNSVLSKLKERSVPEQIINEIARAVSYYEIPVLCEHPKYTKMDIAELTEHLDNASQNLEELKNDIAAINRVLEQPITTNTKIELIARRYCLQDVAEQGYIRISRQQEVALQWLIYNHPESIPLVRHFILMRESSQPDQVYTRALSLIVFRLIESHTQKAIYNKVGFNEKLTVDVITAIAPNLQKYITARTLKAARTGH